MDTPQHTSPDSHAEEAPGQKLERCEKERNEYLEGWKRAKADLINYKKDEARRFEEVAKFGAAHLLYELLTVIDNFDLAIASLEKSGGAEKGMYLIKAQLKDFLKKYGAEEIILAVGDRFDPALHEAIGTVASDQSSGAIVEEIEKGYTLHGKVIRPARVKVAK